MKIKPWFHDQEFLDKLDRKKTDMYGDPLEPDAEKRSKKKKIKDEDGQRIKTEEGAEESLSQTDNDASQSLKDTQDDKSKLLIKDEDSS